MIIFYLDNIRLDRITSNNDVKVTYNCGNSSTNTTTSNTNNNNNNTSNNTNSSNTINVKATKLSINNSILKQLSNKYKFSDFSKKYIIDYDKTYYNAQSMSLSNNYVTINKIDSSNLKAQIIVLRKSNFKPVFKKSGVTLLGHANGEVENYLYDYDGTFLLNLGSTFQTDQYYGRE